MEALLAFGYYFYFSLHFFQKLLFLEPNTQANCLVEVEVGKDCLALLLHSVLEFTWSRVFMFADGFWNVVIKLIFLHLFCIQRKQVNWNWMKNHALSIDQWLLAHFSWIYQSQKSIVHTSIHETASQQTILNQLKTNSFNLATRIFNPGKVK